MMTYAELKKALEEKKTDIRKQIAAVLMQADRPMMAREIGAIVGCSAGTVANMIAIDAEQRYGDHIPVFLSELGAVKPEVRRDQVNLPEVFVSTTDPTRTMVVNHTYKTYYIKK